MKILLIAPDLESKYVKSPKGFKIPYPIMFSTSGLQLLAALTPEHHEIEIIDETIGEKINYNRKYDLFGITAMTTQSSRAYKIGEIFKEKGVTVIMGGYHTSILPREALQYCDAVCVGEGENVWQTMLLDAENGELQQIYQSEELVDLSKVPWPRRSWFLIKDPESRILFRQVEAVLFLLLTDAFAEYNILMSMKLLTGSCIKIGRITIFNMWFSNPCR